MDHIHTQYFERIWGLNGNENFHEMQKYIHEYMGRIMLAYNRQGLIETEEVLTFDRKFC